MDNLNAEIRKRCPRCGEGFYGDETVKGGFCEDCLSNRTDYVCDKCGNPIFKGDEVSVKKALQRIERKVNA